jgi:hypothetical protein
MVYPSQLILEAISRSLFGFGKEMVEYGDHWIQSTTALHWINGVDAN